MVDQGPGITAEDALHIFDKFYRGRGGDTKGGTGLGLAVCRGFVEAMGGSVEVISREDREGSIFRISSPCRSWSTSRPSPPMPPVASAPATVLVIDDEASIRRFLRSTLAAQGYATTEAASAAEGLRSIRHQRPDLVLLDLGLPDRDGMELVPEIRQLVDAPVIVLTVRDAEASKVRALDLGADDYVTKPFSVPELLARMRAALRHRVQAQGGQPNVEAGPITIDLVYRRVTRDGGDVHLSAKEWSILEQLAMHAGRVVTHGHILRQVWGREGPTEQQYLRVYMRQLRQKLEPDPNRPQLLITEPGVGYRLLPDEP